MEAIPADLSERRLVQLPAALLQVLFTQKAITPADLPERHSVRLPSALLPTQ